jgi:hypothetical protein
MCRIGLFIGVLAFLPWSVFAGEKTPKQDYAEFSRLVHKIAVKQLPKQFEDNSGWGQMIEVPANLRLPGLRRIVKVGDHLEAPHGPWRRFHGKIEDPDKNLKIVVKDFKKLDDKTYRVFVDVDATILCHGEWQQWRKGLLIIGADAFADANITAAIVCDVGVSLDLKKFPPELNIEPKVKELGLDLVDFKLRDGPILNGERGKMLSSDLKDVMRTLIKASEPGVKEYANQAIVEGLKQGKGTVSVSAIMKALPKSGPRP